ncbi:hypothetical protein DUNSADRAFT_15806 [Dunaliella salina]|uniref:VWFA domain-containing protein n=1 Tax=Dunaliella salina TaxID=3046 RepID=A0ABQ7H1H9_DUNSA|nr:hypothetical protein DUNSADRAFT_15806 [Dunaliella salina]|eukprot:KAF5840711.1 hypothetical protein DUNSADRAFT_15806 [Dunaliella salina]
MSECTTVLMDNSESTRSGDYVPTRFSAQTDAVNLLAGAKTQAHPENTVGVLTMAGKTPQVLVTPTQDLGRVLNCMTEIDVEGSSNFSAAVQIAQLALKHRQNKNQRQRVVIFVASPIREDRDTLVKIAKKLKKNSVAVDVVSFGCEADNDEKLAAFHEAVNSNNNSHLVTVPPGPVLSDVLIGSPIFQGEGGDFGGAGGAEGGAPYEFGVDPNMDPELALALRVSLEEERARQNVVEGTAGGAGPSGAAGGGTAEAKGAQPGGAPAPAAGGAEGMELDEDALLQQALALSMKSNEQIVAEAKAEQEGQNSQGAAPAAPPQQQPPQQQQQQQQEQQQPQPQQQQQPAQDDATMFGNVDDEELQKALAMSMQDSEPQDKDKSKDK